MNQLILSKVTNYFRDCPQTSYPKGKVIIHANQEPEGVLLLISGVVEQYDITPEGNKITVNIFKPPAFFPMSWAINKTKNTYFYATATDAKLKIADADKTVAFLQANPEVLFDLLSRVYKGTDGLLKRLVVSARGAAMTRLVHELLVEVYRFGIEIEGNKRLIEIRQDDLAARSGLARETVSRRLHLLETAGALSLTNKGIVIDLQQLEEVLENSVI